MYINDTSGNGDGIFNEIDDICKTDATTYTLISKARRVNKALDRFTFLAITNDGSWESDDLNQSNLSIATTNLVSGQQDYKFPNDILNIVKVLAKDPSGNKYTLDPVGKNDRRARTIFENVPLNPGTPNKYDKFNNSLFLDPVVNYNSTKGLIIYYKRAFKHILPSDTLTSPGIPSIFNPFLAHSASLDHLRDDSNNSNLVRKLDEMKLQVSIDEDAIKEYYSRRVEEGPTVVTTRYRNPR